MMETVNDTRVRNRPLAVIDGGLNSKNSGQTMPAAQKPKLLDQVRQAIRTRHYSDKTEKPMFIGKRYILFHNKRYPAEMCTVGALLRHIRALLAGVAGAV
jgi:hypothetical protein